MISLADQLKAQNNGTSWVPCEHTRRGRHMLPASPDQVIGDAQYFKCRRCPVTVRQTGHVCDYPLPPRLAESWSKDWGRR
jgi:hypothetical protein